MTAQASGIIREIRLSGDRMQWARRLARHGGLAVLASDARGALDPADARASFLACAPVERTRALVPPTTDRSRGWAGLPAAPRWIGMIPYEAFRSLERPGWSVLPDRRPPPLVSESCWLRYDAVLRLDHATGITSIEADDAAAAERLVDRLTSEGLDAPTSLRLDDVAFDEPDAVHAARVAEVRRLILRGDVYLTNIARRARFRLHGDPLELFARLSALAPAPYGFFFDAGDVTIAGSSPELALERRGDLARTGPIKGTRPRGADAEADARQAGELDADPKEGAELAMAVDLHRNDLGRVAKIGGVRVRRWPHVRSGPTVHSRMAEVTAELPSGLPHEDLVRAMLPCGSVTGAPKVRAMEVIASLEQDRRGLYTGAFGYVGRDDALVLAMAIRTAIVPREGAGEYFAGGGIVLGSDPEREVEETRWKAVQLLRLGRAISSESERGRERALSSTKNLAVVAARR